MSQQLDSWNKVRKFFTFKTSKVSSQRKKLITKSSTFWWCADYLFHRETLYLFMLMFAVRSPNCQSVVVSVVRYFALIFYLSEQSSRCGGPSWQKTCKQNQQKVVWWLHRSRCWVHIQLHIIEFNDCVITNKQKAFENTPVTSISIIPSWCWSGHWQWHRRWRCIVGKNVITWFRHDHWRQRSYEIKFNRQSKYFSINQSDLLLNKSFYEFWLFYN